MSNKIHPDYQKQYKSLKEELKRLNSERVLDKVKLEVLELTIFKSLPQICRQCGKKENLTLDHIVPKSILIDLDVNEIIEDNYQVLCKYCNGKKSNRLDIREPKVKEILLRVINTIK